MNWDALPRMLSELCDGHPGYSVEVYRLDYPSGAQLWMCKSCYVRAWHALAVRAALSRTDTDPHKITEEETT